VVSQIQVIDRAVRILRELGNGANSGRLTDIAKESGLALSTTRRILVSLVANGMCDQDGQGNYRLGLTVFELGRRAEMAMDLRELAKPHLEELARETRLTSMLGVRHADRVVCIERVDGFFATTLALTVGSSLPLHAGGAARAILHWSGDEGIRSYVKASQPLHRYTPATLMTQTALLLDARQSRNRGWVETMEDVTPGVAALAMPVFDSGSGVPIAAVSVSGLIPHVMSLNRAKNVAALTKAVEGLSASLGSHKYEIGNYADMSESVPSPIRTGT